MKFVQRVILVQTRGISDPRVVLYCLPSINFSSPKFPRERSQLQNKNDPNISFCPVDHPYMSVAKLESEGQKLLEGVVATLYSSQ